MALDEVDARLLQETLRMQDKPYRTRGNPGWVLRIVAKEKVKRCCICGCDHDVELHHEDGNWRNYQLDNLNWYCTQHHQQADNYILHNKENTMTKTMKGINMKWTVQNQELLRQEIQKGRALGMKSSAIFQDISKNSETIFGQQTTPLNIQKVASNFKMLTTRSVSQPRELTVYTPEQVQLIVEWERYKFNVSVL